jgi:hypothetical protein
MKKRIYTFSEYIVEQEFQNTEQNADLAKSAFGKLDAGGFAKSMLQGAMDNLGLKNKDFSTIAETPETKGSKPYVACGTAPYAFIPVEATNKQILEDLFKDPKGRLSKNVKYAEVNKLANDPENKKIFIVGVRESIEIKKREGDKFTDKIIIVDPNKPDEKVVSYQATTTPSLAYYSDPERMMNPDGTAIMDPGVSKYKVGIHRKGSPTQHEALVQAGDMDIQRYKPTIKEFETYAPGGTDTGNGYGINIHRSSTERGVCVGPYSAGCQVFADGQDFLQFMSILKSASANAGEYLYALVQNDDLAESGGGSDKEDDEKAAVADEVDTADFEDIGGQIRNEIEKFNSDEEKIIDLYNGIVTSQKSAAAFSKFYQETYSTDILKDLDRALDNKELEQIKYKA